MNDLLIKKIEEIKVLALGFAVCTILLTARLKVTSSFFFLFLAWNLFLAFIPYVLTFCVQAYPKLFSSKWLLSMIIIIWLLFLPNAPYLISDLQHLKHSSASTLWFDLLLLLSFVWYALYLFYLSLRDMTQILHSIKILKSKTLFLAVLFTLCGFGIYLGRFLRWNSWDVLQDPLSLVQDIVIRIAHPITYSHTWAVTLSYTLVLSLYYFSMQHISKPGR